MITSFFGQPARKKARGGAGAAGAGAGGGGSAEEEVPDKIVECHGVNIHATWVSCLKREFQQPYFRKLMRFVAEERRTHEVFPPANQVFEAFNKTPLNKVRVVIIGQDPYHDNNQAHGMCFSVARGIKIPPSLRNMIKEAKSDVGIRDPKHGCLESWASQGVLLLNTVLTVQAHKANSHRKRGWETFTDAVIRKLNERDNLVFVLWGKPAQKKGKILDRKRHHIIASAHPSPLSASRGFFGTKPFSRVNTYLRSKGFAPIDWNITDVSAGGGSGAGAGAGVPAPAAAAAPAPAPIVQKKKTPTKKATKKPAKKRKARADDLPVEDDVEADAPATMAVDDDGDESKGDEDGDEALPDKVVNCHGVAIHASWTPIVRELVVRPFFKDLTDFVRRERHSHEVFPPPGQVYEAFNKTPLDKVRVVIIGQDPYHDNGQAHGMCFSVAKGVKIPPSLRNMIKEAKSDVGIRDPKHGCLESWAEQGVLLLNNVLTVRAHKANSHRKQGWEQFTQGVLVELNARKKGLVFILWGKPAQKIGKVVDRSRHHVIEGCHPSPLSAFRGFFGSKPFSRTNAFLKADGNKPIDWNIK